MPAKYVCFDTVDIFTTKVHCMKNMPKLEGQGVAQSAWWRIMPASVSHQLSTHKFIDQYYHHEYNYTNIISKLLKHAVQ